MSSQVDSKRNCISISGQSLVEFALVLPILLLIVLGIFDLGRAVFVNTSLSNAAREGARTAVAAAKTDTEIKTAIKNRTAGVPLTDGDITITTVKADGSTCASPCTRTTGYKTTVTINYDLSPLTPMIGGFFGPSGIITLQGKATMVVE